MQASHDSFSEAISTLDPLSVASSQDQHEVAMEMDTIDEAAMREAIQLPGVVDMGMDEIPRTQPTDEDIDIEMEDFRAGFGPQAVDSFVQEFEDTSSVP